MLVDDMVRGALAQDKESPLVGLQQLFRLEDTFVPEPIAKDEHDENDPDESE